MTMLALATTLKVKVSGFTEDMKQRAIRQRTARKDKLWPYLSGEFRIYGMNLASSYAALETKRGILNPAREQAGKEYRAALEYLASVYEMPEDGSARNGLSSWFPEGPHSRADLITLAENEADRVLLRYSAPLMAA